MAHLHLPALHDEDDREMACALAGVLGCAEIYVTWSSRCGPARPVAPAEAPAGESGSRRRRRALAGLLGALGRRRVF